MWAYPFEKRVHFYLYKNCVFCMNLLIQSYLRMNLQRSIPKREKFHPYSLHFAPCVRIILTFMFWCFWYHSLFVFPLKYLIIYFAVFERERCRISNGWMCSLAALNQWTGYTGFLPLPRDCTLSLLYRTSSAIFTLSPLSSLSWEWV